MAVTNGYCTEEQLREQFDDQGSKLAQALLHRAINATSRAIDRFCGRRFWQDSTVTQQTYRPRYADHVYVRDISTTTGLIVATDTAGDGTYATTWAATDYELEPRDQDLGAGAWWQITAVGGEAFPVHSARATLRVTAKHGWSAIPDDVNMASLIKAAALFKRKDSPLGVTGFNQFGPVRITRAGDPDVAELLRNYLRAVRPDL